MKDYHGTATTFKQIKIIKSISEDKLERDLNLILRNLRSKVKRLHYQFNNGVFTVLIEYEENCGFKQ